MREVNDWRSCSGGGRFVPSVETRQVIGGIGPKCSKTGTKKVSDDEDNFFLS